MKTLAVIVAAVLLAQGAAAAVQVGDIPPPHLGTDQDGDSVDLAKMSGKVVVVTFWATWCPPWPQGAAHPRDHPQITSARTDLRSLPLTSKTGAPTARRAGA